MPTFGRDSDWNTDPVLFDGHRGVANSCIGDMDPWIL